MVFDAGDLETGQMLELTRWFNLSETTFLLPPADPSAHYRVRIFTLASVAQWMLGENRVRAPYRASQGKRLGRVGLIHIDQDDEGIWIGGATHTIAGGWLEL